MTFKDRSAAERELRSSGGAEAVDAQASRARALRAIACALLDVADAIRQAGERGQVDA
jgi:hypothetical protein